LEASCSAKPDWSRKKTGGEAILPPLVLARKNMVRLDMSEYQQPEDVARLLSERAK